MASNSSRKKLGNNRIIVDEAHHKPAPRPGSIADRLGLEEGGWITMKPLKRHFELYEEAEDEDLW